MPDMSPSASVRQGSGRHVSRRRENTMGMALPTQYEEALVNAVRWRNFADAEKVLKRVCALSSESARRWRAEHQDSERSWYGISYRIERSRDRRTARKCIRLLTRIASEERRLFKLAKMLFPGGLFVRTDTEEERVRYTCTELDEHGKRRLMAKLGADGKVEPGTMVWAIASQLLRGVGMDRPRWDLEQAVTRAVLAFAVTRPCKVEEYVARRSCRLLHRSKPVEKLASVGE
jgi:hypothetical protein